MGGCGGTLLLQVRGQRAIYKGLVLSFIANQVIDIDSLLRRFFPVFFEHIQYDLHAAELLRVLCNSNAKLVEVCASSLN